MVTCFKRSVLLILVGFTACALRLPSAAAGQRKELQQHVQLLLEHCPLPGYCFPPQSPPPRPGNEKPEYCSNLPSDAAMREHHQKIQQFIAGAGFQARLEQLRQLPDKQGILMSAGKASHIGNAAVILHVLRKHLNCSLPVEIAYVGDKEVDAVTRSTLTAAFAPLYWLDLDSAASRAAYPSHHRSNFTLSRYEPKVFALYHARFQQVLFLDSDNMPLHDPTYLFSAPHMQRHGNMFWMDFWSPGLSSTEFTGKPGIWKLLGLNETAFRGVLAGGQGYVERATESGQLLLDRVAHADVLEYALWLNSFSNLVYKEVLGDKDTYSLAFATAHKLHDMAFVTIPPGVPMKLEPSKVETKDKKRELIPPRWKMMGMTQYDHLGNIVFLHRTLVKWYNVVADPPPAVEALTGPLPNSFIRSHVGNENMAAMYVEFKQHLFSPVRFNCPSANMKFLSDANQHVQVPALELRHGSCPIGTFLEYMRIRDLGLPISQTGLLEQACRPAFGMLQTLIDTGNDVMQASNFAADGGLWQPHSTHM